MELLTIGEFARAAGLSAKALRLYDELGLLRPTRVDEWTGYRYYSPGQLEQARLVAWLRRLGMPLAEIKDVGGLPPAEVAAHRRHPGLRAIRGKIAGHRWKTAPPRPHRARFILVCHRRFTDRGP